MEEITVGMLRGAPSQAEPFWSSLKCFWSYLGLTDLTWGLVVPRGLSSDSVLAAPHRDSDGQRPFSPAADNQDLHPRGWPAGYRVQDPGQVQR